MSLEGKTVAVDFDGVIHSYTSGWKGEAPTDQPTPGAREFLRDLDRAGAKVVIFSTRASTPYGLTSMTEWLKENRMHQYVHHITDGKPMAVAYVDDRAVEFRGNWGSAMKDVLELAELPSGKLRPE
jgi:ribonucleotide monophosphatase NagD (HAD superfamily)